MLLWEWIRGEKPTIIIILIIFLSEFSPMEHFLNLLMVFSLGKEEILRERGFF